MLLQQEKVHAASDIRGVTVHLLLSGPQSQKDRSGESLVELQERLSNIDYILIDEYQCLDRECLDGLTNDVDNHLVQKFVRQKINNMNCMEIKLKYLHRIMINHFIQLCLHDV